MCARADFTSSRTASSGAITHCNRELRVRTMQLTVSSRHLASEAGRPPLEHHRDHQCPEPRDLDIIIMNFDI